MEPKQKASELITKYEKPFWGSNLSCKQSAKECALLCVEEIINDYLSWRVKYWLTLEHALEMTKFWEDVKIEIEKYGTS